jgi:hypothetical protein
MDEKWNKRLNPARWPEFTFHSMVIDLGDDSIRHEEV